MKEGIRKMKSITMRTMENINKQLKEVIRKIIFSVVNFTLQMADDIVTLNEIISFFVQKK